MVLAYFHLILIASSFWIESKCLLGVSDRLRTLTSKANSAMTGGKDLLGFSPTVVMLGEVAVGGKLRPFLVDSTKIQIKGAEK